MITAKQLKMIYDYGDDTYGKYNYDITILSDDTVIFETRHKPLPILPKDIGLEQVANDTSRYGTTDVMLEQLLAYKFDINGTHTHLVKKTYDDFEVCYKANNKGLYDFFALMRRKK